MKFDDIPIGEITVEFTDFCVKKFRAEHDYEEWTLKNYLKWLGENYCELRNVIP